MTTAAGVMMAYRVRLEGLSILLMKRAKNTIMYECRVGALCNGSRLSVYDEPYLSLYAILRCSRNVS